MRVSGPLFLFKISNKEEENFDITSEVDVITSACPWVINMKTLRIAFVLYKRGSL